MVEWNDSGLSGMGRWLNRVRKLVLEPFKEKAADDSLAALRDLQRLTHQTIRKVTQDMEKLHFNTMISSLMEFTNHLARVRDAGSVTAKDWRQATGTLLLLLAPTAPHLTEELWQRTGRSYSIHSQQWPRWDEGLAKDEEITLVVQVNGKLRDRVTVPAQITEDEARKLALARERVKPYLEGGHIARVIYVPKRLINLVVK
jgi:leucyl-tRNA synthetase